MDKSEDHIMTLRLIAAVCALATAQQIQPSTAADFVYGLPAVSIATMRTTSEPDLS